MIFISGGNKLTDTGLFKLAEILEKITTLKTLDLDFCL